jgi:hypothetical protein
MVKLVMQIDDGHRKGHPRSNAHPTMLEETGEPGGALQKSVIQILKVKGGLTHHF